MVLTTINKNNQVENKSGLGTEDWLETQVLENLPQTLAGLVAVASALVTEFTRP